MNFFIRIIKRYSFFLIASFILLIMLLLNKEIAFKSIQSAKSSFMQMVTVLPPIMILLGLMDVWIPRETLIKYMGDKSGVLGIILAMLIGSIAAGPMYAAFPFTTVLIKKGAKFSNIIIFMNAWCVTKISTLLFEFSSLGYKFTLIRLAINIPGVIIMGYLVQHFMDRESLHYLYKEY